MLRHQECVVQVVVGIEMCAREQTLRYFLDEGGVRITGAVLLPWPHNRLLISKMICVASDPTPCKALSGSQRKSAPHSVCTTSTLTIALGTSVGWAHQGTHMPLFFPTTPLVVHILRPAMVVALRSNCTGNPLRQNIRVTIVALQEQGTSLSLDCTSTPPAPFIRSATPLHHVAEPWKIYKAAKPNITKNA